MATRVWVAVEAAEPTVASAAGRVVNVETPVAEGAAVAAEAAGVAVPSSGGVGVRGFSTSSFCPLPLSLGSV